MEDDRIHILWRYPHATSRTVLVEMAFVLKPQITVIPSSQGAEFFYIFAAPAGLPWQSADVVFVDETLARGTTSSYSIEIPDTSAKLIGSPSTVTLKLYAGIG